MWNNLDLEKVSNHIYSQSIDNQQTKDYGDDYSKIKKKLLICMHVDQPLDLDSDSRWLKNYPWLGHQIIIKILDLIIKKIKI